MKKNISQIENLLQTTIEYFKINIKLIKLKTLDSAIEIISSIVPNFIIFVLSLIFYIFLNIGLAIYFGNMLTHQFYGYFIIASFNVLLAIIIKIFFYKKIKRTIGDYILKLILT